MTTTTTTSSSSCDAIGGVDRKDLNDEDREEERAIVLLIMIRIKNNRRSELLLQDSATAAAAEATTTTATTTTRPSAWTNGTLRSQEGSSSNNKWELTPISLFIRTLSYMDNTTLISDDPVSTADSNYSHIWNCVVRYDVLARRCRLLCIIINLSTTLDTICSEGTSNFGMVPE